MSVFNESARIDWLYRTVLRLSYLFQVEFSLFSTRAFSKGNYLITLFKIGLLCFINKLSLTSNLYLLESRAKLLNLSKIMAQLHRNRWPDIADCLMILSHFPVRLEIPMCSAALALD